MTVEVAQEGDCIVLHILVNSYSEVMTCILHNGVLSNVLGAPILELLDCNVPQPTSQCNSNSSFNSYITTIIFSQPLLEFFNNLIISFQTPTVISSTLSGVQKQEQPFQQSKRCLLWPPSLYIPHRSRNRGAGEACAPLILLVCIYTKWHSAVGAVVVPPAIMNLLHQCPKPDTPTNIMTNALNVTVGAVLQKVIDGEWNLCLLLKNLKPTKGCYTSWKGTKFHTSWKGTNFILSPTSYYHQQQATHPCPFTSARLKHSKTDS